MQYGSVKSSSMLAKFSRILLSKEFRIARCVRICLFNILHYLKSKKNLTGPILEDVSRA